MATDKKIQRIDAEKATEMYADSYQEMEELKQQIKEAKAEIDKDHAEQMEALVSEMEQHAKVLQEYSKQNRSETTEMPNGVKFGFFPKESYVITNDNVVDSLQKFQKEFPSNYDKFLTGYPKFSKTKVDRLVEDGHISLEKLAEMGIEKQGESEFEVKVPKKK